MPAVLMSPGRRPPRSGVMYLNELLLVIAITLVLSSTALGVWTFWLAGQIAGLATCGAWPDSSPADAPGIAWRILAHPDHPAAAWPPAARGAIPHATIFYATWGVVLTVHLLALLWLTGWVIRTLGRRRGFATRRDLNRLLTEKAVLRKAPHVRPGLVDQPGDTAPVRDWKATRRRDVLQVARTLGRDAQSGTPLYSSIELSELVQAPPRQGKTRNVLIGRVIDAPGPVISTSTRLDVAAPTFEARAAHGPALIFDPQGGTNSLTQLRWSPVAGCEDPMIAIIRGAAFAAGAGLGGNNDNSENAEYFRNRAASIIRSLLRAAALADNTITDVVAWAKDPTDTTPETILRHHGAPDWALDLTAHRRDESRTKETVASVVRQALDCFADPRVLAACTPNDPTAAFNPQTWLAEAGTLYLVGTRTAQALLAPLLAAIVEDLAYHAQRKALTAEGGRCEPPLSLVLDEVANIAPLPSLPALMSEGGGSGVPTTVVAQSRFQLEDRWGAAGGKAIVAAANVAILLGGSTDNEMLRDIASLAGQVEEVHISRSYGGSTGASTSEQTRRENLINPADLRTLPEGHALVLAGNVPPVEVVLDPWDRRRDGHQLRAAAARFATRIRGTP